MSPRTTSHRSTRSSRSRLRPPSAVRRPSLYLAVAAAGAVLIGTATTGEPTAAAEPAAAVSIADQLGIAAGPTGTVAEQIAPLEQLAASRSERENEQAEAAAAQKAADEAARKKAAEEAARKKAAEEAARKEAAEEAAREEAERQAAEEAAAEEAAAEAESAEAEPAAAAPSGSYQDYALSKLGGDASQFSCLESLWGKESGWNPNAQNPTSSAYGIPQFLDSTWAGTGIAKTSDGYRQIDAGLIYINNRYGSPCAAWSHSQANNWY
jgi:hypothetical protein